MNQPPKDAISSDEIIAFIQKQQVSEEKATGIKLLRRSAETIAFLNDRIALYEDGTAANPNPIDLEHGDAEPDALEQIALALGLEDYSLQAVLQKIERMHTERNQHVEAITHRDAVIRQAEEHLMRQQAIPVDADAVLSQEEMTMNRALQEASQFGYALIGYSYHEELPEWVVHGAQEIIQFAESNKH